jgi:hypothetical protein
MAAAVAGGQALFVGGVEGDQYDKNIDIYDSNNNTWTSSLLPTAAGYMAGTQLGDLALFGGGVYTSYFNTVYIFDSSTDIWSQTTLSTGRMYAAATTVGNTAIFAGGYQGSATNAVDIYQIPEPSTSVLVGVGAAALLAWRARRSGSRM